MARILIVYGTTEGHTRKIARTIADQVAQAKHDAKIVDAADPPARLDVSMYDAVIVASSVHAGRHQSSIEHFVREHAAALNAMPTAFVSVCLSVISQDPDEFTETEGYVETLLKKTGWTPKAVHHAAGALKFVEYDWIKRQLAKGLAKTKGMTFDSGENYEFTDWRALETFVAEFLAGL